MSLVSAPPKGLLRLGLRLPIVLYRLRLGWLLGGRFILLNHIGRKSGQARQTVLEVVGHDERSDTYFIVSGWGHQSNWYRNLLATPDTTAQVGRRHLNVRAETLSPAEGAQVLLAYREKHALAARELGRLMGLNIAEAPPDELEHIVQESLPVIALRPREHKA